MWLNDPTIRAPLLGNQFAENNGIDTAFLNIGSLERNSPTMSPDSTQPNLTSVASPGDSSYLSNFNETVSLGMDVNTNQVKSWASTCPPSMVTEYIPTSTSTIGDVLSNIPQNPNIQFHSPDNLSILTMPPVSHYTGDVPTTSNNSLEVGITPSAENLIQTYVNVMNEGKEIPDLPLVVPDVDSSSKDHKDFSFEYLHFPDSIYKDQVSTFIFLFNEILLNFYSYQSPFFTYMELIDVVK